jgi:mercuric ion binding protein
MHNRNTLRQSTHNQTTTTFILVPYSPNVVPAGLTLAGTIILLKRKDISMRKLSMPLLALFPLISFAATTKIVTLNVQNVTCEVCGITIKKALEKVNGVSEVKVDFDKKTATVSYDPDKVQPENLTSATTNAGFPSTTKK